MMEPMEEPLDDDELEFNTLQAYAKEIELKLSDEEIEELYGQAYCFYEAGKYSEAVNLFRALVSLRVEDSRFWNGIAASSQMLREYRAAIEAYAMAAIYDAQSTDPFPHFHAAQCYHSLGEKLKGVEVLEAAAYVARKDERYQALLGQIELLKQTWLGDN